MTCAQMAETGRHPVSQKPIQQPHFRSDEKRWRGRVGARFSGTKQPVIHGQIFDEGRQ